MTTVAPVKARREAIDEFWTPAVKQGWRMSWGAWKTLALSMSGWGVADDDSPFLEAEIVDARAAEMGWRACTIGPGRHFGITVGDEIRFSV